MEWLEDLRRREERLRSDLGELSSEPELIPEEEDFRQLLRPRIQEIQAVLDDYLCGRNESERAWMSYEVNLNLPVFCHLRSIFAVPSRVA